MAAKDLLQFLNENDPAAQHLEMALYADELRQKFGGQWGEHPQYPAENWRDAVASEDTRLGYWEWVFSAIDFQTADQR